MLNCEKRVRENSVRQHTRVNQRTCLRVNRWGWHGDTISAAIVGLTWACILGLVLRVREGISFLKKLREKTHLSYYPCPPTLSLPFSHLFTLTLCYSYHHSQEASSWRHTLATSKTEDKYQSPLVCRLPPVK